MADYGLNFAFAFTLPLFRSLCSLLRILKSKGLWVGQGEKKCAQNLDARSPRGLMRGGNVILRYVF